MKRRNGPSAIQVARLISVLPHQAGHVKILTCPGRHEAKPGLASGTAGQEALAPTGRNGHHGATPESISSLEFLRPVQKRSKG